MRTYFADAALLPQGWADNVLIEVEASGNIASVTVGGAVGSAERLDGIVIPGMVDLHSHAFQRALAGLTQRLGADEASFWTWRDTMYQFAQRITPDEQRAIAAQLQVELLKGGYTSVVEFHYLHHQPDGSTYDEPAAMSLAIHEAALEVGIALTLLPVVYMQAGVDGGPLAGAQRRFALDPDGWARLAGAMDQVFADDPNRRVGLALHSVRAAPQAAIAAAVSMARSQPLQPPIHIHIAEQPKEVRDCLQRFGRRPLELLGEVVQLDQNWCLVHGTHLTDAELALVAERQAVVGLCPTTEADLGDGIFPLAAFLASGGRYGVGSDSNMATDAAGELRLLEQGQRLAHLRRAAAASEAAPHCGRALWSSALLGGAHAVGRPVGQVAPGFRADLVVLDPEHPSLYGRHGDLLLDSHLFAPGSAVRDVMVGGSWCLRDGHHAAEHTIARGLGARWHGSWTSGLLMPAATCARSNGIRSGPRQRSDRVRPDQSDLDGWCGGPSAGSASMRSMRMRNRTSTFARSSPFRIRFPPRDPKAAASTAEGPPDCDKEPTTSASGDGRWPGRTRAPDRAEARGRCARRARAGAARGTLLCTPSRRRV